MRRRALWVALGFAGALVLASCAEDPITNPTVGGENGLPPSGLAVSEPLETAIGAASGTPEEPAYVSASPGTFPRGIVAEIRNTRNRASVRADIVDGGFDPVPVSAVSGDELEITVHDVDGGVTTYRIPVPPRQPPRVVRTRPPLGATDIVLSSSIAVVFSEPVLRESVTPSAVKVMNGREPVDGTLSVRLDGLYAQFTPDEPLRRQTTYTLLITTDIVDLDGDALEEAVEVSFTTENPPASNLSFVVEPGRTHGNQTIAPPVVVAVHDSYGVPVPDWTAPVTLTLTTNPRDGSVFGRTTVEPVNGVARFTDLRIDRAGGAYVLSASSAGLPAQPSEPFEIYLDFTSVQTGYFFSCGTVLYGDAYCWGHNGSGRLGDGTQTRRRWPVLVSNGLRFRSVSAQTTYSCGVTSAGAAFCWGENFHGQLGDGTNVARSAPVPVAGGIAFELVSAGTTHTCGVTADGEAYCWGDNFHGQLGDGTTTDRGTPVRVAGGLSFTAVSAGLSHTCGRATDGSVYCWGFNDRGQLGDGTREQSDVPRPVAGGRVWSAIEAGHRRSCGVTASGEAYCWGMNNDGQVGDGTHQSRATPVPVHGGLTFTGLAVGPWRHTCGLATDGQAYCWGSNRSGQLGDGTTVDRAVPSPVAGQLRFLEVDTGFDHTCGVTTSAEVFCWGANDDGQLGDATSTGNLTPRIAVR